MSKSKLEIILEKYLNGYTHAQIMREFNLTESSVKVTVERYKPMREILNKYDSFIKCDFDEYRIELSFDQNLYVMDALINGGIESTLNNYDFRGFRPRKIKIISV